MRRFLIVANVVAICAVVTWLRIEWRVVARDDFATLWLFFVPAIGLLALNLAYVKQTPVEGDWGVQRFARAFMAAWKSKG